MKIINGLNMNDKTILDLVGKLGIRDCTIEFKLSDKLLEIDGIPCLGSCLDRGNKFIIVICNNDLHGIKDGNIFHTLTHELYHVFQFQNDLELNCDDADSIALELFEV